MSRVKTGRIMRGLAAHQQTAPRRSSRPVTKPHLRKRWGRWQLWQDRDDADNWPFPLYEADSVRAIAEYVDRNGLVPGPYPRIIT